MSKWSDKIPHRLLLNRSLRKAGEELRHEVDLCQAEFDNRKAECIAEIERAALEKDEAYNSLLASVNQRLVKEEETLSGIKNDLCQYADAVLLLANLKHMKRIKIEERGILNEDNAFLKEQIDAISEEIQVLKDRQDGLTLQAAVDDIIALASISGAELSIADNDNALSLLYKVNAMLNAQNDVGKSTRFALLKLKGILQERSDYLSVIQYISWLIDQKVEFRKQLAVKRKSIKKETQELCQEIDKLSDQMSSIEKKKKELAGRVRYYWLKPITYINAEISYAKKEEESIFHELEEVKRKLNVAYEDKNYMKTEGSSDQMKWDRINRDIQDGKKKKEDLKSDIESKKRSIQALKGKIDDWFHVREIICDVLTKCNIILPDKGINRKSEELSILNERIEELSKIEEDGREEAERICEAERARVTTDYNREHSIINSKIQLQKSKLVSAIANTDERERNVEVVSKHLRECQAADKRSFLKRMFSGDTDDVYKAKKILSAANAALSKSRDNQIAIEEQIRKLEEEESRLQQDHTKKLGAIHPHIIRPTAAERSEMKRLVYRRDKMLGIGGGRN